MNILKFPVLGELSFRFFIQTTGDEKLDGNVKDQVFEVRFLEVHLQVRIMKEGKPGTS